MTGRANMYGVVAGVFVAVVMFLADRAEQAHYLDEQRAGVVEAASGRRAMLEAQLNARLHLVTGLSALVKLHPGITPEQFKAFAAAMTEKLPGLRSVQLAPGAMVTHVWPEEGNRAAIGHDLLADPDRRDATRRTIEGRRMVVAGPYALKQGGVGLVAREPIFLATGAEEAFWGLAVVVIEFDPLIKSAGLEASDSYRFALRGADGLGGTGNAFFGDQAAFAGDPVLMDVTLPHGNWQMAAVPEGGWGGSHPGRALFAALALAVAVVASILVSRLVAATARARASEQEFRTVFNQTYQGIATTTAQGVLLDVNDTLCARLGRPREELIGRHFWEARVGMVLAEEAPRVREKIAEAGAGRLAQFEVTRNSHEILDLSVKPICRDDGGVRVLVVEARDISNRKREEAVQARNFAATQALSAILRLSLSDESLEHILDKALEHLLSLPWLRIEPRGSIFLVDPDGRTMRMAAWRHLPDEICASCRVIAFDTCLCGKAAATRQVVFADHLDDRHEIRFAGMSDHGHYCVPIIGSGEVLGVLNTYLDSGHRHDADEAGFLEMVADTLAGIIRRKQIEETLRRSRELAKTLMDASADAAFLMDREGIILAANEALAARFKARPDDLAGRSFFTMIPPDLAAARYAQFDQVMTGGKPLHTHDDRDGLALDNRIYPVLDADGSVGQVAVFSRDVTEQRRAVRTIEKALADLARSNEELKQFAYVASHDLRQPLRMVSSYLTLIERRLGDGLADDIKEFIGFAVDGAKRMDQLILDLLDYSRIGRGEAEFVAVPLAEAVADAHRNLEPAIRDARGMLAIPADLPVVQGDHIEISRLFQNLIGNALKYHAPDRVPRVEIGCRRETGHWLVWVKDNGIGIAPADQERAFQIFQRLAAGHGQEGTGIGLSICRKIVEHHGGRIWVESELGEGATFFFTLPPADTTPAA